VVPTVELKERKPLTDVGQVIQPSVKDVQGDEKDNDKDIDEVLDSSCVYSPMSVDHDKSVQSSSSLLTSYRFSSDIDTYTCELYSYLRNFEVTENY